MPTVTLPGGNGSFISIKTGTDDHDALQAAIKAEFNAARPNITYNKVAPGDPGKAGFFNLVLEQGKGPVNAFAGTGVQAIIDVGTGKDTLTGDAATNLIVTNSTGDLVITNSTKGTQVFGGPGNDTVDVNGKAQTYLEGGDNQVNLKFGGDSVSLLGAGAGKDTVNIAGKGNTGDTVSASYDVRVNITATKSNDTLSLNGKNSTISLGTSDTITLTGKGDAFVSATGSATVIGGAGGLTFVGAANGHDVIKAGAGGATITAGANARDSMTAGGLKTVMTHGKGGSDTMVGVGKGGSDTMVGAGTDKTHTDLFVFKSSVHGGTHTILNFTSGKDTIDLQGYSNKAVADAIAAGAKTFNAKTGTETITLSDHTKITVHGLKHALTKTDVNNH